MLEIVLSIFENSIFERVTSQAIFAKQIHQFLIYPQYLSKYGGCELQKLALEKIPKEKMKVVWDLLPNDDEFDEQKAIFQKFTHYFSGVRFQDPGVGFFLKEQFPKLALELNVERFSHNIHSVLHWQNLFLPNLQKIILSNLTPLQKIETWRPKISTKLEILGAGSLEIFYSPRKLLTQESNKEVWIESTDRLGALHRFVQNHSGTIMYNSKDICVLAYLKEIMQAKVDAIRLEPNNLKQLSWIEQALASKKGLSSLAQLWQAGHLAGFLKANKTNAQFAMLKNKHLYPQKKHLKKIGKVVESKKGEYSLLSLNESIDLPCFITIYAPEQKVVELELNHLMDIQKKQVFQTTRAYYFTDYIPRATPNSLIYKNDYGASS